MGTRITDVFTTPCRRKLAIAEQRLGQCQTVMWKYASIADHATPELVACVDELHLTLLGYERQKRR